MAFVNGDMVLIGKSRNGNIAFVGFGIIINLRFRKLHRPTCILRPSGAVLPVYPARFYVLLLLICIALSGCCHNRSINDLPTHHKIAGLIKIFVKVLKQLVNRSLIHKMLPIKLDRLGLGHIILKT